MRPSHISLIIWCIIFLLAVLCFLLPDTPVPFTHYTLKWPTIASVLNGDKPSPTPTIPQTMPDTALIPEPMDTLTDTLTMMPVDTLVNTAVEAVADTSTLVPTDSPLARFYASLETSDTCSVRIVHYGDSQIEEDRITRTLRRYLQQRYGGLGVGLIPLHQTIPSPTIQQQCLIRGVPQTTTSGPRRYLVYGPKRMQAPDSLYGPMGQVAVLDPALVPGSDSVTIVISSSKQRRYANAFTRIRLLGDDITFSALPASSDTLTDYTLQISSAHQGRVYGLSLESPTGVHVDNIPMRGCLGNIFTRIDANQLSHYFATTNTRLIILQFGGNAIPSVKSERAVSYYVSSIRRQVRYLRCCAPQADMLFIGPSDMLTNIDGELTTYPLVPFMDKSLRQMAQEEHIAYFSIFDAMGGAGSMLQWHEKGLAADDYIHFTPSGADRMGTMLTHWLFSEL